MVASPRLGGRGAVPLEWAATASLRRQPRVFVQGAASGQVVRPGQQPADARVWTAEPRVVPPRSVPGRAAAACTQPPVVGEAERVDGVVALPAASVASADRGGGEPGPRVYEYLAEVWAWFSEEGLPGPRERLGKRCGVVVGPGAGAEIPPLERAGRGTAAEAGSGAGDAVDDRGGHQVGQGEQCGLDEYETRGWTGWHHHTALSMLGAAAVPGAPAVATGGKRARLLALPCSPGMTVPEVRALLVHLLEVRAWDRAAEVLRWSALASRSETAGRPSATESGGSPSEGDVSEVEPGEPLCACNTNSTVTDSRFLMAASWLDILELSQAAGSARGFLRCRSWITPRPRPSWPTLIVHTRGRPRSC